MTAPRLFLLVSFLALASALAGANEDWTALVALDAGPGKQPTSREEAQQIARNFLALQEKAINNFLLKYPKDPHAGDARIRLAEVWATQGSVDNDQLKVDDAIRLLTDLESTVPPERRADAAFLRVSLFMQSRRDDTARLRDEVVRAARNFATSYPQDRRAARVLVEAATICDDSPGLKIDLLNEAERLNTDEPLRRRIADDRKRIDHLGKPLSLALPAGGGAAANSVEAFRGQIVVLVFWASDAPHSVLWMRNFRTAAATLPGCKVITISLDADVANFKKILPELAPDWLNVCDGKGWQSPLARDLGINALPSVWMIDKTGVVRTINAKSNYQTWIRLLARE